MSQIYAHSFISREVRFRSSQIRFQRAWTTADDDSAVTKTSVHSWHCPDETGQTHQCLCCNESMNLALVYSASMTVIASPLWPPWIWFNFLCVLALGFYHAFLFPVFLMLWKLRPCWLWRGCSGGTMVKNVPANARDAGVWIHEFDPWVRKIPWSNNGNPLQYSCLKNSMHRET